jgi:hypothetical protein
MRCWRDFESTSPNKLTQGHCCFTSPTTRLLHQECGLPPLLELEAYMRGRLMRVKKP